MKILFMGTPHIARAILDAVACVHSVSAIFTRPDKPSGRGKKYIYSPVKEYALANDIPLYQPKSLRTQEVYDQILHIAPDLILVVAYGAILPQAILDIPTYGALNVHASLLPTYRGAAPIQRALWNNEKETGITIMKMDAGLDTGDILLLSSFSIEHTDTTFSLMNKMAQYGTRALLEVLTYYQIHLEQNSLSTKEVLDSVDNRFTRNPTDSIQNYVLTPEKQNDSLATFAEKISKEDTFIKWNKPVECVHAQIAAVSSRDTPSACAVLLRENLPPLHVRIMLGTFDKNTHFTHSYAIGELFFVNDTLYVQCSSGYYQLLSIRPESKNSITAKEFYSGYTKGKMATFLLKE